jgi:hypothetical protein
MDESREKKEPSFPERRRVVLARAVAAAGKTGRGDNGLREIGRRTSSRSFISLPLLIHFPPSLARRPACKNVMGKNHGEKTHDTGKIRNERWEDGWTKGKE